MTIIEAIRKIESLFIVHDEIGMPVTSYGSDDSEYETGARNWSRAPCGERYIAIVSSGVFTPGEPMTVLFSDAGKAIRWWTYAVMDYAETIAPEAEWSKLHLYWREKPQFETNDYMPINAAEMLQSASPFSVAPVSLGTVYSRLVISKLGPDGSEEG
jgi:hypothetical protein